MDGVKRLSDGAGFSVHDVEDLAKMPKASAKLCEGTASMMSLS